MKEPFAKSQALATLFCCAAGIVAIPGAARADIYEADAAAIAAAVSLSTSEVVGIVGINHIWVHLDGVTTPTIEEVVVSAHDFNGTALDTVSISMNSGELFFEVEFRETNALNGTGDLRVTLESGSLSSASTGIAELVGIENLPAHSNVGLVTLTRVEPGTLHTIDIPSESTTLQFSDVIGSLADGAGTIDLRLGSNTGQQSLILTDNAGKVYSSSFNIGSGLHDHGEITSPPYQAGPSITTWSPATFNVLVGSATIGGPIGLISGTSPEAYSASMTASGSSAVSDWEAY
jgi:hypothetical protein